MHGNPVDLLEPVHQIIPAEIEPACQAVNRQFFTEMLPDVPGHLLHLGIKAVDDILVRRGRQITFKGVTFPIEEIAGVNYRRFGVGNSELLMYRSGILTIILKSGVKLRCVGVKGVEAAHDRLIALMRGDVKEDSDEIIG